MKKEFPPKQEIEKKENQTENVFETRKKIIEVLKNTLEASPKVLAAFLAGSDAQNKLDKYSDIDFDIVLNPEDVEEVEKIVRKTLETISPIKTEFKTSPSGTLTIIYLFKNFSKFLHVDVLFITNPENINDSEINVLFDKKGIVKPKEISEKDIEEKIKQRVERIEKYSEPRESYIEKPLFRGQYREAEEQYRNLVLKPLIEALRLKYCPKKSDYHVKDVEKDLPEEVAKKLDDLFNVPTIKELEKKYKQAKEWLNDALQELKK